MRLLQAFRWFCSSGFGRGNRSSGARQPNTTASRDVALNNTKRQWNTNHVHLNRSILRYFLIFFQATNASTSTFCQKSSLDHRAVVTARSNTAWHQRKPVKAITAVAKTQAFSDKYLNLTRREKLKCAIKSPAVHVPPQCRSPGTNCQSRAVCSPEGGWYTESQEERPCLGRTAVESSENCLPHRSTGCNQGPAWAFGELKLQTPNCRRSACSSTRSQHPDAAKETKYFSKSVSATATCISHQSLWPYVALLNNSDVTHFLYTCCNFKRVPF